MLNRCMVFDVMLAELKYVGSVVYFDVRFARIEGCRVSGVF